MRIREVQLVFGLNLLLVAHLGFSQDSPQSVDHAFVWDGHGAASSSAVDPGSTAPGRTSVGYPSNPPVKPTVFRSTPFDRNADIYYKNKLELGLDVGWLPINIPFPFDFMMGDNYNTYPLKYTGPGHRFPTLAFGRPARALGVSWKLGAFVQRIRYGDPTGS